MSFSPPTDAQALSDPHVARLSYFNGEGRMVLSRGHAEEMKALLQRVQAFGVAFAELLYLGRALRLDVYSRAHRGSIALSGERTGVLIVNTPSELLRGEPMPHLSSISPQTGNFAYDKHGQFLSLHLPPALPESRIAPLGKKLCALFALLQFGDCAFTDLVLTATNGRYYARHWSQGYLNVLCLMVEPSVALSAATSSHATAGTNGAPVSATTASRDHSGRLTLPLAPEPEPAPRMFYRGREVPPSGSLRTPSGTLRLPEQKSSGS
ncbi:MAG: hypothetical protein ACAI35_13810 [Candidatus Methylacidiphilales bacterium]|nr:hypothetical protein [Candidatus Methylacidiphilales bacterium]